MGGWVGGKMLTSANVEVKVRAELGNRYFLKNIDPPWILKILKLILRIFWAFLTPPSPLRSFSQ